MKAAAGIGVCKQGFFENETSDKDPFREQRERKSYGERTLEVSFGAWWIICGDTVEMELLDVQNK